jgi:hypothetical protein
MGGDFARQTLDALVEPRRTRQADVLREAMAAFGPTYPVDRTTRSAFFAWSQ